MLTSHAPDCTGYKRHKWGKQYRISGGSTTATYGEPCQREGCNVIRLIRYTRSGNQVSGYKQQEVCI